MSASLSYKLQQATDHETMKHLAICKLGDMYGDAVIFRFTYCNLEETHLVSFAISGYRCLSLCRVFDFGTQAASPIRRSAPWNWSRLDTKWVTSASVYDFFSNSWGPTLILVACARFCLQGILTLKSPTLQQIFRRSTCLEGCWRHSNGEADFQCQIPKFKLLLFQSQAEYFTPLFGFLSWLHFLTWALFTSSCSRSARHWLN